MGGEDSLKWDSPFEGQPLGIQGKEDDFISKKHLLFSKFGSPNTARQNLYVKGFFLKEFL